jgi:hypothetical protein
MGQKKLATATLIKHATDDGLVEMNEDIQLGKTYQVDINTIRNGEGFNIVKNIGWKREVIDVSDGQGWRWMPTEMLLIEKENYNGGNK